MLPNPPGMPMAAGAPPAPGPGMLTPPVPALPPRPKTPEPDLPPLPLPSDGRGSREFWKKEIQASNDKIKELKEKDWDPAILSYRGKPLTLLPEVDTVVVPRDFPFVEQKNAQLFFQVPEVHLTAKQDGLADAVSTFQPVLNYYLSEDEVDALCVMNETGFDALVVGLMVSKIGYESFKEGADQHIQDGEMPDPDHEPVGQPGQVLGLGAPPTAAPMVPNMVPVPNIVYQRYFWERISPAAAVIPSTFHGSNYDKAKFLGYRFEDDWEVIRTTYKLPADMECPRSRGADSDDILLKSENRTGASTKATPNRVRGTELWYRAAYFDPQVGHPEKFRCLVLIDGLDTPLVHKDSPYQYEGPDGKLMGMMGNPIHIGALRYLSDSAFPPSETQIARATNDELNKSRTQMMLQRDRSIPMRYADLARVGGEAGLEKIRKGIYQGIIPLSNYDPNNPPIGVVQLSAFPRENFSFNDYLDKDLGQIWSMGANQRGQENSDSLTATEVSKIDQWATSRLDKERRQILRYFIRGTRKLSTLIQKFATDQEYIEILGPDQAPRLQPWNKDQIQGKFLFTANPDSAIRVDQAQARTQILKLYEMWAKDPNVNRVELLTEACRQWNLDPKKMIIPQLPEKGPDPASVSIRFAAADLDVQNANFPIYAAVLKEAGYKSLDQPDPLTGKTPIQMAMERAQYQQQVMTMGAGGTAPAQPPGAPGAGTGGPLHPVPHGGTAPKADHINKHQADESGDRPGPKV
jgi:hypothetical protein